MSTPECRKDCEKVEPNHPLAEILATKLFGIEGVPTKEQTKMVASAIRAAVKWAEPLEAENKDFTKLRKICKAIMAYNEHVPTGSDQYMLRGDMFRIMEEIVKKGRKQ